MKTITVNSMFAQMIIRELESLFRDFFLTV